MFIKQNKVFRRRSKKAFSSFLVLFAICLIILIHVLILITCIAMLMVKCSINSNIRLIAPVSVTKY